MTVKLDTFDLNILQQLANNGRISWRDLADEIGLSLTPTLRRIKRLESEGLILGYAAKLNERRLAGTIEALISVTLDRQSNEALSTFELKILEVDEVTDCLQITGEYDYVIRVVVSDLDHYQLLLEKLSRIPMLSKINSSFVLKIVTRRPARIKSRGPE